MKLVNQHLQKVLESHGLSTRINDKNWIVVNEKVFMYGELVNSYPNGIVHVDVGLALKDKRIMTESFAGLGETEETGIHNALENFAINSLPVILFTFFGLLSDQLTLEQWAIQNNTYQVILGQFETRNFNDHVPFLSPLSEAVKRTITIRPLPNQNNFHWCRIFYSQQDNKPNSIESLLDNQPWADLSETINRLPWPQQEGFYSIRQFFIFYKI